MPRVVLGLAVLLALAAAAPGGAAKTKPRRAPEPRSAVAKLDTRTLPRLLRERGFEPPRRFKALVIVVEPAAPPPAGAVEPAAPPPAGAVEPAAPPPAGVVDPTAPRLQFRPYDWRGTSDDREDWWPASSVKLFAATAALEAVHALGFTPAVRVTFHYDESTGLPAPAVLPRTADALARRPPAVTLPLERLVRAALIPSDNQAYDRLVELVGFDRLNRRFLSRRNGLRDTVLLRSYAHRVVDPATGFGSPRHSPPLTLSEGGRAKRLPERHGRGAFACPEQGNCSSLRDLAEALRRVMLHEELPPAERLALGEAELTLLRSALAAARERGNGVVDGLRAGFGGRPLALHHKPGYAYRWFSDVVFVQATDTGERWIVAMAGYPGRGALDDAARHVGALLAEGRLRPAVAAAPAAPAPAPAPAPGAAPGAAP